DRARLDRFLEGANVLINTVGPFKELGLPVVEAAVRNCVAYLDSTGEPNFMEKVCRRFRDSPVPVVPACGFDCIPGDLAAAVAAADLGGAVTEVGVHYELRGMLPSRGTARSALAGRKRDCYRAIRQCESVPLGCQSYKSAVSELVHTPDQSGTIIIRPEHRSAPPIFHSTWFGLGAA